MVESHPELACSLVESQPELAFDLVDSQADPACFLVEFQAEPAPLIAALPNDPRVPAAAPAPFEIFDQRDCSGTVVSLVFSASLFFFPHPPFHQATLAIIEQ